MQEPWFRGRTLAGAAPPRRVHRGEGAAGSVGGSIAEAFGPRQGAESVTAATALGVRYAPRRALHPRPPPVVPEVVAPVAAVPGAGRLLSPDSDDGGDGRADRSRSRRRERSRPRSPGAGSVEIRPSASIGPTYSSSLYRPLSALYRPSIGPLSALRCSDIHS